MSKLKQQATRAITTNGGKSAWWYENKRSIEVYIETDSGIYSAKIQRRHLKDWIKRTEAAKEGK